MEERCPERGWYEVKPRGELLRYALSAMVVGVVASAGAKVLTRAPAGPVATETTEAVLVDLPPALASSSPRSEAPDGPEQAASQATPAAPPAPPPKPDVETPPDRPPEVPRPDAVIEKKENAPPPPPVAAAPDVEAQAPSGADAKAAIAEEAEAPAPSPDAHALAAWQRAMVERLEAAKHRRGHHSHTVGTVIVAFRIDRQGRVVEEHVNKTSASTGLDAAALGLLADASPFPVPPPGLGDAGLTFTVPIRFNPRR